MSAKEVHLLLAEDDPDDCYLFEEALKEIHVKTTLTIVSDGVQLMQFLNSENSKLPHMLFLDLNMPLKRGYECLNEIRLNPKFKQLPIVIFTTSYDPKTANELQENGAQYFIRKPSNFVLLKNILGGVIDLINSEPKDNSLKSHFILNQI